MSSRPDTGLYISNLWSRLKGGGMEWKCWRMEQDEQEKGVNKGRRRREREEEQCSGTIVRGKCGCQCDAQSIWNGPFNRGGVLALADAPFAYFMTAEDGWRRSASLRQVFYQGYVILQTLNLALSLAFCQNMELSGSLVWVGREKKTIRYTAAGWWNCDEGMLTVPSNGIFIMNTVWHLRQNDAPEAKGTSRHVLILHFHVTVNA